MIWVDNLIGFIVRLLTCTCLTACMMLSAQIRADTEKPATAVADLIHIRADNMKYDMKSGVSSYTGNVHISSSGMELSGDTMTVKQQNNEIESMVVTGRPARYHQTAENGEPIVAESLQMDFSTTRNQLILTNNARLEQAGHVVESQRIIYDTAQEVVIAEQINPYDRVNITLTPKKKATQQPATEPQPDANTGR
jgi:lipopolysaccharide export system protein LptA